MIQKINIIQLDTTLFLKGLTMFFLFLMALLLQIKNINCMDQSSSTCDIEPAILSKFSSAIIKKNVALAEKALLEIRDNEIRKKLVNLPIFGHRDPWPSLHEASSRGDQAMIQKLIEYGADVNAVTASQETALMVACTWGHDNVVQTLLKFKANPNKTCDHYYKNVKTHETALMRASWQGYTNIVYKLLKSGADIEQQSTTGKTALHLAAAMGHADVITMLLTACKANGLGYEFVDKNSRSNETAFDLATNNGYATIAHQLLNY